MTAEAFAPFGVLPPVEGDGNPTADLVFTRDDGWVNYIGHTLDEIEVVDGALRCELLNRHDTHTQTLMPMSGDAVVVVAPADVDFSEAAHFDTVGRSCCRSTRACICTAARGTGARIPSAPTRAHLQHPGPRLADRQRRRCASRRITDVAYDVRPNLD